MLSGPQGAQKCEVDSVGSEWRWRAVFRTSPPTGWGMQHPSVSLARDQRCLGRPLGIEMKAKHYLLRLVRHGPLVPARQQWLDHEPGEPSNKRDRGGLLELVDIAGEVRPPEELHERLYWPRGHWKFCQPIVEAEYRYLLDRLRWAEENEPDDPTLTPRRRIDPRQGTLPSFERENAYVRR